MSSAAFLLQAGLRWLSYLAALAVVGGAGFRYVSLSSVRRGGLLPAGRLDVIERRAATWGLFGAGVLLLAYCGRLYAQTVAMFGPEEPVTGDLMLLIAFQTRWGDGWVLQVTSAAAAMLAYSQARWAKRPAWSLVALVALGAALVLPLTGHPVAESFFSLPALSQMVHSVGASVWLGTLLVTIVVGTRHLAAAEPGQRAKLVATMIRSFSPLALFGAGCLAASGLVTAFLFLDGPEQLLSTSWGLALLLKLLTVGAVVGLGFYNWRRVRPRLDEPGAESDLVRAAGAELALAALVLLITAVFVGLPVPHEMQ